MERQLPHSPDYLRQVLAECFAGKSVRRVQAFGSYARDEATAGPDVGLLPELERPVGREFTGYAENLGQQHGPNASASV